MEATRSPSSHGGGGGMASKKRLIIQVFTGPWFSVFASLLIMFTAGTPYAFGLCSNVLVSVLGYVQSTLNLVSFFKDVGTNVGLIAKVTPTWLICFITGCSHQLFWVPNDMAGRDRANGKAPSLDDVLVHLCEV